MLGLIGVLDHAAIMWITQIGMGLVCGCTCVGQWVRVCWLVGWLGHAGTGGSVNWSLCLCMGLHHRGDWGWLKSLAYIAGAHTVI